MNEDPAIVAALLGTAGAQALPAAPDPRLAPAWQALAGAEPAEALLGALAFTRSLRLAGARSAPAATEPDRAPAEMRPELPPAQVDGLLRMLAGEFREVLPEWLRHAGRLDALAPPRVIPELLHAGRREIRLRPALARLCGERARWLARRRPEHDWLLAEAAGSDAGWDADSPAERLAWLHQARRSDPTTCAARIAEAWAGESPDFRESLARLAAAEPEPADEPWLESLALRERRADTRRFAAGALAQLPGSAFARRALERLRPLVAVRRKLLRHTLAVEPPAAFDSAWAADGIVEKPPPRTGERAWWLRQLAAALPLARWSELLGMEPADWLDLPVDSDWREPLVFGWIDAALAAPGLACGAEFLPWLAELDPWPAAQPRTAVLATVLPSLPPPEQPALLDRLAAALKPPESLALLVALADNPPPAIGATAFMVVRAALAAMPGPLTRPEARALALCIPLAAARAELEHLARLPELGAPAEEFATTLEFRLKLLTPS